MDLDLIKKQVKEVIQHSQEIDDPKTDQLVDKWLEAKKDFFQYFNGEPIYKTENKITVDLTPDMKQKKVSDFCSMLSDTFCDCDDLIRFISFNVDSFFNNILDSDYNTDGYHIKAGIKMSKAFKYFVDNDSDLYFIQTAASQVIQENKISGYLCFSVHPLDYLSSSENNYNWRSCHALDGDYRAGNLSYMLDSSTVVCYLCGDDNEVLPRFPASVPWNSKKWRMLLFLSDNRNALFAGRQYPFFSKTLLEMVRKYFLSTTRFSNIQITSHVDWSRWHDDQIRDTTYKEWDYEDASSLRYTYIPIRDQISTLKSLITDMSDLHFDDLLHSSCYEPYYCWNKYSRDSIHFTIGSDVECLQCGNTYLTEHGVMICRHCQGYGCDEYHHLPSLEEVMAMAIADIDIDDIF